MGDSNERTIESFSHCFYHFGESFEGEKAESIVGDLSLFASSSREVLGA